MDDMFSSGEHKINGSMSDEYITDIHPELSKLASMMRWKDFHPMMEI
jgi:beta-lactamase superfamily II metal-dependent hydrolase